MVSFKRSLLLLTLIIAAGTAQAKILLPQILSNNMVLQRDKPVKIWGYAAVGERVNVRFAGQSLETVTDGQGNWQVVLEPLKTSAIPATMTIHGSNTVILDNILVGEVWLCSGQSNMEYGMRKLAKVKPPLKPALGYPVDELEKAANPQIRIFLVNRKELSKPDSIHKSWNIARDSALKNFSAAGYFFAKELYDKLHIPIGIISSAVSGSPIEPWIPKESLESGYFKGQKVGNDPGKFYTPMIEPITAFALRGFLWYQGETNCFLKENITYSYKMKALIQSWRAAWKAASANPAGTEMPFYYVQIAPFNYAASKGKVVLNAETEPEFWEAQAQLLRIPGTGMVGTNDLNDYPEDLHPTYKWEIGRRLALWALMRDYGQQINCSGPLYQSVKFNGAVAELNFAYIGKGLMSIDDKPLTGFSIAAADGRFVPATAVIRGNQIRVSAKGIQKPVAVRFGWNEALRSNLFNRDGLPAMAFRTDNPLVKQFTPL